MKEILYAVLVLGIMGAVFGAVLAIASKVFAVKTDERLPKLVEALPGANCGGCGFAGCQAYAQAVLEGRAEIGLCVAGGQASADQMAAVMGVTAAKTERVVAMVRCRGHHTAKARYDGIHDCRSAMFVGGNGPSACPSGCLGFGSCVSVCRFDAIPRSAPAACSAPPCARARSSSPYPTTPISSSPARTTSAAPIPAASATWAASAATCAKSSASSTPSTSSTTSPSSTIPSASPAAAARPCARGSSSPIRTSGRIWTPSPPCRDKKRSPPEKPEGILFQANHAHAVAGGYSTVGGRWCTSRSPDVSLRGAKRRGNLAVPSRITGRLSAKS